MKGLDADTLLKNDFPDLVERVPNLSPMIYSAAHHGDDPMKAAKSIQMMTPELRDPGSLLVDGPIRKRLAEAIRSAQDKSAGRLYRTELDVEPEDLLDWDLPLSQQSEKVREALSGVVQPRLFSKADGTYEAYLDGPDGFPQIFKGATKEEALHAAEEGLTGANIIKGSGIPSEMIAARLREAGIPGIRYLDQGSRGGGEGTRNFVIFDDKLVKILGKE
jgi:hypothetical protein